MFLSDIANFAKQEQQPKKRGLLKKALKYGAIGGVGLAGLAGTARYGGAALKYRTALRNNALLTKQMKPSSFKEIIDSANTINKNGARGQIKRDIKSVKDRLKGRKNTPST